jgi:hypothetical protein
VSAGFSIADHAASAFSTASGSLRIARNSAFAGPVGTLLLPVAQRTDVDVQKFRELRLTQCCQRTNLLPIRLHVDAADEQNGCLNVFPGSHRLGILTQKQLDQLKDTSTPIACVVSAGDDAVIMRPHVVHVSGKSIRQAHRRVAHLEYSSYVLPAGIDWA